MTVLVLALVGLLSLSSPLSAVRAGQPDAREVAASVVRVEIEDAEGTGFVVGPGKVLTAAHVVEGGRQVFVVQDGVRSPATVDRRNTGLDLALLSVEGLDLPSLELAPAPPDVLAEVFVFGNPLGNPLSVSRGIVSAVTGTQIQTDAAINPGNSGGPMVDADGRVVGLVVAKERDAEGVGFAVPVNRLREFTGVSSEGSGAATTVPDRRSSSTTRPSSPTTRPPATTAPDTSETDDAGSDGSSFPVVPVGGAVLAATGIAAVVWLALRRRQRRADRLVVTFDDINRWNETPMPTEPPTMPAKSERIVVGPEILNEEGHQ